METIRCDIHGSSSDKNLLLDDENVESSRNCNLCLRLHSDADQLNGPLFNITNINWQDKDRVTISNSLFLTSNTAESRLSINSGDSTDAPLLLREQYNDFDNMDEFHCHPSTVRTLDNKPLKKLLAASGMCLFFMIAEIIGGYLANSLSIMTDAAHLLSDFIGFLVSVFSIWIGQRPSTKRNSWGFHRAEVLGALFSIIFIWLLTAIFTYLAIVRLISGKYDIDANTMILCATIGVFINLVMGLILHSPFSSSHSHSHGHSHGVSNLQNSEKQGNINVRAAVIHVLGDFIQSIGVLVAALIIKMNPDAKIADPICTFIFSIIVIFTTKSIIRDTISVLMESVPFNVDYDQVMDLLTNIDGIRHVHSLHIWSLTTNKTALTAHLAIDKFCENEEILKIATRAVRTNFNIANITLQVEKYKADVMDDCADCQLPKK